MKNVLITGGSGFMGYHLVERLKSIPDIDRIVILDRSAANIHDSDKVFLFQDSIEDHNLLAQAMDGCDTVFHLAANADISKAATKPATDFWDSTYLTQCVLECARTSGVKRLFFTSGSGVYGDRGCRSVVETMATNPVSPYGAAKVASEAMIQAYSAMFGIKSSIFRFGNVVGPHQTHGVAYDFIRKLRADPRKLEILGDGKQAKPYVHVNDVIDAMMLVADKQDAQCDIWNVATEGTVTVSEIAALVIASMCMVFNPPEITFTGGPCGWKGDVPVVKFSCDKIRALGWNPTYPAGAAVFHSILAGTKEL